MAFDILSYLMATGGMPTMTRAAWESLTIDEKREYKLVGVIDSSTGFERGVVYYGEDAVAVDEIKRAAEDTSYCRLSNHVGDGAAYTDRRFTRTTDEPVIMCGVLGGSYAGYAIVTKSSTAPGQSATSYGNLVSYGTLTVGDVTLYVYTMRGMMPVPLSDFVYTYDEETVRFDDAAYLLYSSGINTVTGNSASGLLSILSQYAAL